MNTPLRVLLFSTLYPSSVRPGHGIFVAARLQQLLSTGSIEARVVAPVPWFPFVGEHWGEYAQMARTPAHEAVGGVDVFHPRYPLPPKIGMSVAPLALALGAAPAVRRLIRSGFNFDVIDAHYYYPDGVAAALLARRFGKPLVITARGSDINRIADHVIPRRWMRWAARQADTTIAVSEALAAAMQTKGIGSNGVRVLRNGVDLERFRNIPRDEARRQIGWPEVPTIITVGNLLESKGQRIAIEALRSLPAFHLCVVGSGPDEGRLRSLARDQGVAERVRFYGRVPQERMSWFYSAADILVLPSSREGAPNVVLEAMACGTPVVATAVGGIPEFVSQLHSGGLMADRTVGALVAAIQDVCSKRFEPEAIRAYASRFGWEETTRGQLEVFSRLVRPGAGSCCEVAALATGGAKREIQP
jgi:glycosyltransferase involved in cell wall biosynthesis